MEWCLIWPISAAKSLVYGLPWELTIAYWSGSCCGKDSGCRPSAWDLGCLWRLHCPLSFQASFLMFDPLTQHSMAPPAYCYWVLQSWRVEFPRCEASESIRRLRCIMINVG